MPSSIPQVLLPYLAEPSPGSLLLVTSVLNAPANWLVVRSISAALHADQNARPIERDGPMQASTGRRVVLLSLLRPLSLWIEIGKKSGLDILNLLAKRQLSYIDGLEIYGKVEQSDVSALTLSLRSHALEEVQNALWRAVRARDETTQTLAATADPKTDIHGPSDEPVLVIDGLDFLIASQPNLTAAAVSQMLTTIRQRVHCTILTVSSDGPLLHDSLATTSPLEKEHQALVATLAHQSQLVMQLRGLYTGAAKDVSGVIRISLGGAFEGGIQGQSVAEGEWLYKVSGDGSVRVWGRGE